MTYFSMWSKERMTRLAFSRCLTSRYDDGSSNMYMSASCTATTAMANRCSSPPDNCRTSRSRTASRSSSSINSSTLPRSSLSCKVCKTCPLTALGMWSTYWGLISALMSSSRIRVR
mmetsp:Transcript_4255/g.19318  ORF Transcript_4255/g.19318 Transcript_4255/m.19318 type:complete len:116 (-) Transcript_4255:608-955(-)